MVRQMSGYPTYRAQPTINESPFVAQSNSCDLTVNRVRIVLLAGAAFCATSLVAAQGIGWLDLTDPHPRGRIRAPQSVARGAAEAQVLLLISKSLSRW